MQKKFAEEQARLRAATSEAVGGVDRLRHVTAASATPYLVLSGNVKPGQISDPLSGYATSDRAVRASVRWQCLHNIPCGMLSLLAKLVSLNCFDGSWSLAAMSLLGRPT